MLTFAETSSNAAMEGAIGRRLLALIRPGVVNFASPGGKKCTKGLSCGGSCISKAKVCIKAMNPAQKKQYKALVEESKVGGAMASMALEDFKAALKPEISDAEKESIAAKADKKKAAGSEFEQPVKDLMGATKATDAALSDLENTAAEIAVKADAKKAAVTPEVKVETNPTKAGDAKKLLDSDLSAAEKSRFGKRLETLDYEKSGDRALRDGIFHMAEVRGQGEDLAGASASMDRVQELDRLRGKKTLTDSDVDDAAISMRQSIRGPNGSPINKASAVLGQEVYDRLSDDQKNLFAKKFGDTDSNNIQMDDFVRDSAVVKDMAKRREAAAKPSTPKASLPMPPKEPERELTQEEIDLMWS